MRSGRYGYVLFHTSAAAFRAERLCADAGIPGARLVPTPRALSSDCGVSLRFDLRSSGETAPDRVAMEGLLSGKNVPYDNIVAE